MIKNIFFIVFLGMLCSTGSLLACDACGCSASNIGIGLMTDYRSNFIRLGYFRTRYKANSEHEHAGSDIFTQVDLSFRYAIGKNKKIWLTAHVPFNVNVRNSESEDLSIQGLSDIRLIANYVVLNNIPAGEASTLYVEAGAGLNLPTGQYDENLHERNLPENFNLGRGNLGYIIQTNAILGLPDFGLMLSGNYQLNSNTQSGYHFGNQFNTQIVGFKEFIVNKFKLIPNAGLSFESIAQDAYSSGKAVPETGGEGLFLSSSLNFKTEKWLAGFSYSMPVAQHYSQNTVTAKERIAIHLSFIF